MINITSSEAVNLPPIRLLVNDQRPDERGTSVDVPGTLVDLLADPMRDRFYVLRQDRNQLLIFDGSSMSQIASLRTAATPTRMAFSFDCKFLLVGHDNAQLVPFTIWIAWRRRYRLSFGVTIPVPLRNPEARSLRRSERQPALTSWIASISPAARPQPS